MLLRLNSSIFTTRFFFSIATKGQEETSQVGFIHFFHSPPPLAQDYQHFSHISLSQSQNDKLLSKVISWNNKRMRRRRAQAFVKDTQDSRSHSSSSPWCVLFLLQQDFFSCVRRGDGRENLWTLFVLLPESSEQRLCVGNAKHLKLHRRKEKDEKEFIGFLQLILRDSPINAL